MNLAFCEPQGYWNSFAGTLPFEKTVSTGVFEPNSINTGLTMLAAAADGLSFIFQANNNGVGSSPVDRCLAVKEVTAKGVSLSKVRSKYSSRTLILDVEGGEAPFNHCCETARY